jgi:hypothetical protein
MKANSATYIGVSTNSVTKWQIRHAREGFQRSIGTVDDETSAAILADIFVLQCKGIKARTNFDYRKSDLIKILSIEPLWK